MILLNLLRLSIRNFKKMKLRSTLTILGIGIGIGAILFLVALGQGLQRLLIDRITTAEALLTLDVTAPGETIVIDQKAVDLIDGIELVQGTSPVKIEQAKASFDGVIAGVTANFVEPLFFELAGLDKGLTTSGDSDELFPTSQSMLVSSVVLDLLSIQEEPLGKVLEVRIAKGGETILEGSYTIHGIIEDTTTSIVYVPLATYPKDKLKSFNELKVQVTSTDVLEDVRSVIIDQGFVVSALSDTVRQANRVFSIMKIVLAVFGTIALIVAAIGMFNTMTIALLERTNEIGIMRSIGASRRDIWLMFLIESFLIGFLGGLSGVFVGVGAGEFSNFGLNTLAARLGGQPLDMFYYPLWFIIGIVLFSTVVAFITGFYPARRAAHLNPLDALRYK